MNFKQLQYAVVLSEIRSFSQASEMLDITQPSLSKLILNLEKELGIKLFDRNTQPLSLTPAGEQFISQARSLLYQEDQMLRSMEQYKIGEKGRLTIGISPFRNLCLMPAILSAFREKYPGVQVVLYERTSDQLRKEAAEGKYDFAIVNLPVEDSVLDTIPMEQESLVLAVPKIMLPNISHKEIEGKQEIDFSCCKDLPFVVVAQGQEMRRYFDSLCASHNIKPEIAVEVAGGVTAAWSMARAGLGATLLPLQFVDNQQLDENLMLFMLKGASFTRQPVIAMRRGQYLSKYAKYAIELLINDKM